MQSSVYRKINNDIKVDKHTTCKPGYYEINNKNNITQLKLKPVTYNQLSLYFFEPANIDEFYSEHYDKFLSIIKVQPGCYLVQYPDGNKNYFYYEKGVCVRVSIKQSLFNAEIILSQ